MNIDLANVPPVPIQIGVAGENAFRTITFDASTWGADFPDATYTVVYKRSDGYIYPVLVNAAADAIVWSPTDTDTAVSGNGQIEVRLLDGETIGKTIVMQTFVAPSLSGDESEPSTPAPDWVNDVAADADRAEAAVSHYPKIVNGVWFVWDATQSEFVSTGINAQGEDGVSPTVTVTEIEGGHRVTITDADGAHTFDVMDGEDGEGGGSAANAVLYTAQSLTDAQKTQARTNVGAGTYSKPSGGIPKTDLASDVRASLGKADSALQEHQSLAAYRTASAQDDIDAAQDAAIAAKYTKPSGGIPASDLAAGVIPTVPQMATQTNMSDWASGKTVDASAMKTVVSAARTVILENSGEIDSLKSDKQNAPLEIPVTESGDTYTTTATAEQIRAAKENSVFVVDGEARIKALLWFPWDEGVELLIGMQMVDSTITAVAANVSNNSVSIRVEQTPIPALATDPNMTDWDTGKTVDAAVLKNGVQYIERTIEGKADASDIPTAVSQLQNDRNYQTASDVQTAISGVRQLPAVTASDNGKFLRVVNGAWAAETVQTWQGGSY